MERQRHGYVRRRPRGADRGARSARRDSRRALDGRRRSRALPRASRHQTRREGCADRRGAAADAEDARRIPAACRSTRSTRFARRVAADRSQFFKDLTLPFYGYNRPGAKVSQGVRDSFWLQGMMAGLKSALRLHQGVLRNRLHRRPEEDRRAHADHARRRRSDRADRRVGDAVGEADQERTLKVYKGFPHGMCTVNADVINQDLLEFIKS